MAAVHQAEDGAEDSALKPGSEADESQDADIEILTAVEYYAMFDKMPLRALVPPSELVKPGAVIFTDENIHLVPFGCNLVPYEENYGGIAVDLELGMLKEDIGLPHAKVPLEIAASRANVDKAPSHCAVCGKEAHSKCQNCMKVAYCTRDHQTAHWKDHRPFCVLYEVVQDPRGGPYLIAKTNIKKGEAILLEEFYCKSPFSRKEQFRMLKFVPISDENQDLQVGSLTVEQFQAQVAKFPLICMGCYTYLGHHAIHTCECGWPICGKECAELDQHQNFECSYFKENMIVYEECRKLAVLSPRIYGIIRTLLQKRQDQKKWDELLFDATYYKVWNEKLLADVETRANVEYILVTLRTVFQFKTLQYSEICSLLAVIEVKGMYGCTFEHGSDRCRRILYVHLLASMIRHRCLGNVFSMLTCSGKIHVIASKSIKKGEILFRNHDSNGDLLHILHRQLFSTARTKKPCDCQLCVDENAIENSLSAVVCLKCKRRGSESLMTVETPASVDSSWKCQKCNATKTNQQMRNLLQDITKDLEIFECEDAVAYESALRIAIAKYKGNVLHQDNAVILSAEYDLIYQMFNNSRFTSLNSEELHYLTQLLKSRINNLHKFMPEAHSSVVSMKMRLATVMTHVAYRIHPNGHKEVLNIFEDMQLIYDNIAESFVENTVTNALQGYILICLRKLRKLLCDVGELFNDQRQRSKATEYVRMSRNLQTLVINENLMNAKYDDIMQDENLNPE